MPITRGAGGRSLSVRTRACTAGCCDLQFASGVHGPALVRAADCDSGDKHRSAWTRGSGQLLSRRGSDAGRRSQPNVGGAVDFDGTLASIDGSSCGTCLFREYCCRGVSSGSNSFNGDHPGAKTYGSGCAMGGRSTCLLAASRRYDGRQRGALSSAGTRNSRVRTGRAGP